jgi:hypothetical protein
MIGKNLSRRLERLETTVMPTSNPVAIILQFYSPEKVMTSSMSLIVDLSGRRRSTEGPLG